MPERVNFLRQCARSAMAAVLPRSLFMTRGPSTTPALFLTFDDGPHPEHTPRLLDLMAERSVKGTFFLVGEKAERFPQIVRRITEEGHAVGNHTWSHPDPKTLSAQLLIEEIRRTNSLLGEITGKAPALFRPPHGKLTARKFLAIWRMGYTVALWNVDPKDYSCSGADEAIARLANWQMKSGDIILLHDVHDHIDATVDWIVSRARTSQPATPFRPLVDLLTQFGAPNVAAI